jgi:hypothetical protein
MSQEKLIEIRGVPVTPGSPLDKRTPSAPGIWDDDHGCGGSTRHMARLANGTLFDLGNAGSTKHLCHIFDGETDTFDNHPVDHLDITTPPNDLPREEHHSWMEEGNYAQG